METPMAYGTFHVIALLLTAAVTICLSLFFGNTSDKRFRGILLIIWITLVLMELYKQVSASLHIEDGIARWAYKWGNFPFQFCDTLFYLLPIAIFLKESKLRDAAMAFLATYALFAGALVLLYPGDVFTSNIGLNIHTMYHHGMQTVIGIYLFVYNRKRFTLNTFVYAIPLFVLLVAIAQILNVVIHAIVTDGYINLFYISPYFHREYPLVGALGEKYHWSIITSVYTVGFTAIAFIVYAAEIGLTRLLGRKKEAQ